MFLHLAMSMTKEVMFLILKMVLEATDNLLVLRIWLLGITNKYLNLGYIISYSYEQIFYYNHKNKIGNQKYLLCLYQVRFNNGWKIHSWNRKTVLKIVVGTPSLLHGASLECICSKSVKKLKTRFPVLIQLFLYIFLAQSAKPHPKMKKIYPRIGDMSWEILRNVRTD